MSLLVLGSSVAFVAYLLAAIAVLTRLFHPKGPNLVVILTFASIAIVAHSLTNSQLIFHQDVINISLPNVVSLVTLIISLVVSAAALRYKINLLLPVVYGFAGLWQIIMLFLPTVGETPLIAGKLLLVTHITLSLIAYCVLIIAMLYAFQVAYINVKLKNKNLLAVSHLPPLMQVENQLFSLLAVGTLCLIISQLTGFIFLEGFLAKENAHKTVLSLLALIIYVSILWGHFKRGWRGHKVLVLTITASCLLTLSYFGSRFVKEFLLS